MTGAAGENAEIAVIGLARSGRAAAALLASLGARVYASDAGDNRSLDEAAGDLRARGVDVDVGRHDLARIARAGKVVVSPGIASDAPAVRVAREAGVPVVSEVTIALEALRGTTVIAVTGTNGKSTTTALTAHLLRALGTHAVAAGNIGTPLSEIALRGDAPRWVALEVSSFQLHDMPGFAPDVGVLTNLSPDHLDRYDSVEAYYADKARMFACATGASKWVVNGDDAAAQKLARGAAGSHFAFSLTRRADAWYDRTRGRLVMFDGELCARADLRLLGEHNVANALAAALAAAVVSGRHVTPEARASMGQALATFAGLPHRLELVAELNGVQWINDSKATNVGAARTSLEAMERPTILLVGGRHKGESYSALAEPIRARVRHVIAYGEAAGVIERELRALAPSFERLSGDFADVVARARAAARPGDAVLLAPACSSFDMFRDYEERGERFRELATAKA